MKDLPLERRKRLHNKILVYFLLPFLALVIGFAFTYSFFESLSDTVFWGIITVSGLVSSLISPYVRKLKYNKNVIRISGSRGPTYLEGKNEEGERIANLYNKMALISFLFFFFFLYLIAVSQKKLLASPVYVPLLILGLPIFNYVREPKYKIYNARSIRGWIIILTVLFVIPLILKGFTYSNFVGLLWVYAAFALMLEIVWDFT